jgi:hypothetical protein
MSKNARKLTLFSLQHIPKIPCLFTGARAQKLWALKSPWTNNGHGAKATDWIL